MYALMHSKDFLYRRFISIFFETWKLVITLCNARINRLNEKKSATKLDTVSNQKLFDTKVLIIYNHLILYKDFDILTFVSKCYG